MAQLYVDSVAIEIQVVTPGGVIVTAENPIATMAQVEQYASGIVDGGRPDSDFDSLVIINGGGV